MPTRPNHQSTLMMNCIDVSIWNISSLVQSCLKKIVFFYAQNDELSFFFFLSFNLMKDIFLDYWDYINNFFFFFFIYVLLVLLSFISLIFKFSSFSSIYRFIFTTNLLTIQFFIFFLLLEVVSTTKFHFVFFIELNF